MRAVTWHGTRDVRVEDVPDPKIEEPTDAIIRVTSTALCGSDLHLYEVLGPFMDEGDILGHEAMGIVEEVGTAVEQIAPGDRVVIPFNIACGRCFMCDRQLYAHCETTQVREHDAGARIYGYSRLYGSIPGGQAEYLRVPQAHFGPIKVPAGPGDERYLFLSDVLPTAWQGVVYADIPEGGTLAVFGLGPIGQLCARIAWHRGARVIGIDPVAKRREMAARHGVEVLDWSDDDGVLEAVRARTDGRGPDSVIDAVGMEAHGAGVQRLAQKVASWMPSAIGEPIMKQAGIDRLSALMDAFEVVRRNGTVSISGVYGGQSDPFPMLRLFDKGVTLRMGQAHVRRWLDELLPLVEDDADPLGLDDFVTHRLPLRAAPEAYAMFQEKRDGAVKVVFDPNA